MTRVRALLVEDEAKLARLVARGLTEHGHVADVVGSGEEALAMVADGAYDVVLLDVRLPGMDGFEICRRLRAARVWTPVVMLTARTAVADRIAGLDAGADDYLPKPFAFDELLARMRAVARRGEVPRPTVLTVGDLRLDPASRRAWRARQEVTLSAREFALLEAFMRRPGRALTRDELLEHAWGWDSEVASNVVDVYVRYLREKVDRPYGRRSIETVRGTGYRLIADGANSENGQEGQTQGAVDGDG
jgi:two-component system OmpR family response regulator